MFDKFLNLEVFISSKIKKSIFISGSVAFDTLLEFNGSFSDYILPDKLSNINVAFLVPKMRREFGGCAANIAYNLAQLGDNCLLLGSVGKDAKEYIQRLSDHGIITSHLTNCTEFFTAQAFITTDNKGNQLTSFHPGAMNTEKISDFPDSVCDIGIISPNSHFAMFKTSENFHEKKIPFVFDPGQALPMFEKSELLSLISKACWLTVNEYEGNTLKDKLNTSLESLVSNLYPRKNGGIIQTLGKNGCKVFTKDDSFKIKPVVVKDPIDPTGCGDAFRAGMLYGLSRNHSLYDSACLGNVIGSIKVKSIGGQNHSLDSQTVKKMMKINFPKSELEL